MTAFSCPVCAGTELADFRRRARSRCAGCGALERTRVIWMALGATGLLRDGVRIAHFAPELCLVERLAPRHGALYRPFDIDPGRYANPHCRVEPMDLCTGLAGLPEDSFDLILHNHVLEHVPCRVETVLAGLDRILAPGGTHLFSVPFDGARTREDLNRALTGPERERLFLQHDHMRMFGREDFPALLRRLWGSERVMLDLAAYFTVDDLAAAAIRPKLLSQIRGSTMFARQRPSAGAPRADIKTR